MSTLEDDMDSAAKAQGHVPNDDVLFTKATNGHFVRDFINTQALRESWVGREIHPEVFVIDIREKDEQAWVICFSPTAFGKNSDTVHRFVTWAFDPESKKTIWGHYCKTIEDAVDDLRQRLGIDKEGS